ncbi:DUF3042 family protein [Enterococcus nangangensis]|uniref:DUF3042 family protein n=1 Tax=Enterococcus nangangensis TaxID=2559926 RepID=UPI0010F4BC11|nr:DUF3042 family protein [Enterococcus nangangensis]
MRKFVSGYLLGTTVTVAFVAGLVYGLKKTVIEPIEEKEQQIEDNRKKAARKSFAR